MADVTLTPAVAQGAHSSRLKVNQPYLVWKTVTGAEAAAAKGSALAAADVLKIIDVPANTVVQWARIYVVTPDSGTTLTMDLGWGSNVDLFTDGGDAAGSAGWTAVGTNASMFDNVNLFTAADTLDIVLASLTAANDDWVIQVAACMVDADPPYIPNSTFG